jgi:hypothetical protein
MAENFAFGAGGGKNEKVIIPINFILKNKYFGQGDK